MVTFNTQIILQGNNTGIAVPESVMSELGPAKRYPVVVTVGNTTYRSSVSWYRGQFMISLSAANRAAAGVAGGDDVSVTIERDDAPREVEIPDDLLAALKAEPGLVEAFSALSFTNQNRHVTQVTGAKAADTRLRRVQKVLDELRG